MALLWLAVLYMGSSRVTCPFVSPPCVVLSFHWGRCPTKHSAEATRDPPERRAEKESLLSLAKITPAHPIHSAAVLFFGGYVPKSREQASSLSRHDEDRRGGDPPELRQVSCTPGDFPNPCSVNKAQSLPAKSHLYGEMLEKGKAKGAAVENMSDQMSSAHE
ncbi:hypothetical protein DPEC_G00102860 [Dallia pectoralis]|uniref:Uncharacterized protein n=1 Tax=Dallia pectoralis TaxID=75939 RepID=A0ACC2GX67_DALPE|nr:hypothetical protein DPEC_G00102860 [Dallia pectoralis]